MVERNERAEDSQRTEPFDAEAFLELDFDALAGQTGEALNDIPSATIARALERLEVDERRVILRKVDEDKVGRILSEMDVELAAETVSAMREARVLRIIEDLAPDDAVDMLEELGEEERGRILAKLQPETAQTLETLSAYGPETAGGIMTPDFATLEKTQSVDQAIAKVRKMTEELETIYYLYVVDRDQHLEGVVSMRDLLLARPGQRVESIMHQAVHGVCHPEDDQEDVARLMAELNLLALPVVDANHVLIGIVTHDDVMDIVREEATEDIQRMVGAGGDEGIHAKIGYSLKKRSPWLIVNLGTAVLAAAVVYFFQAEIRQLTILAVFLPIIGSLAGNAGSQTLAVAIRSLAVGEIQNRDALRICLREMIKGFANGLLIGLVSLLLAQLTTDDWAVSGVVGLAMVLTMSIAGLSGAVIPLLLKRFDFDPAQSSSIFLTAVTDLTGFFIFLKLGAWLLI
ncbi:MAG: magnesium transporter [Opitutales bacterium]